MRYPEQQIFPVMFYRKDILEELGPQPPQTWDDMYDMISVLQKHHLEFYLHLEDAIGSGNARGESRQPSTKCDVRDAVISK